MEKPAKAGFFTSNQGDHRALEWMALALPVFLAAHFLLIRIRVAGFPTGDEGSWMAVASQWARGYGFTTLWLEHHWLAPYALPRPDDFRYPGLVLILGAAFRIFGITYPVALLTIAGIFLAFVASIFLVLRKPLGFWPAYGASGLTACSLLQLEWNSQVYTEGLFGLALCGWVHAAWAPPERRETIGYWLQIGMWTGLITLVRPNGILLLTGILAQFFLDRRSRNIPWNRLALGGGTCLLILLPWLIRNAMWFGSPFHIAGSAGFFRDQSNQSHNLGLVQYFGMHSPFFPILRVFGGMWRFLRDLHFFEHGLEILPLSGLFLWAVLPSLRRRFTLPASLLAGFSISFAACAYAAWGSWAGVRYFTAFLPFVYGLGFYAWRQFLPTLAAFQKIPKIGFPIALLFLSLLPVFYPHRFYERHFTSKPTSAPAIEAHHEILKKQLPPGGLYYAKNLCQLNFATDFRCVGLQELYDSTWFGRSEKIFQPRLMALRRGEDTTADIRNAVGRYVAAGFGFDTVETTVEMVYLKISAARN